MKMQPRSSLPLKEECDLAGMTIAYEKTEVVSDFGLIDCFTIERTFRRYGSWLSCWRATCMPAL